jgi:hypothetical protein
LAFLIAVAVFVASLCLIVATFLRLRRLGAGWPWWVVFSVLLSVGWVAGVWLAFDFEYQISPRMRFASFPVPLAVFTLEDGQWADYVPPPPVIYAGLVAIVTANAAIAVVPLLLASFAVKQKSVGNGPPA